ncbi:MAG TPA: type III pantothenate kinase [Verrucomicrobiota bacterium]|nr:type III pantothenate kinase [Verrucomicrobiales bacterium]HRI13643.1 type III pantothenate kinase [Verrucomicrobiota bacterium]
MILLLDIGNTNTHVGLANRDRVIRARAFPTSLIRAGEGDAELRRWLGKIRPTGACLCSVVPAATSPAQERVRTLTGGEALQLTPQTMTGVGIDYPRPETIGQDRLANAVAAQHFFGGPVVVVDFGTAVTFDVVDRRSNYVGGIIAPGLAAMTDYLHEKTALLPRIRIREPRGIIGRNTEQAMLVGAVRGYRGLVRGLIGELRKELKNPRLPVVATGGYAALVARHLPEITQVRPNLTLEGLRLVWLARHALSE